MAEKMDFKKTDKLLYMPGTKPSVEELGDPRKTAPEKLRTVLRLPVRKYRKNERGNTECRSF